MNIQAYRTVFYKEFRELLRDRRSLFWLLAPPFILPAIAGLAIVFIGFQSYRIASQGFPIIVENGDQAPELLKRLEESATVRLVDAPPDPHQDPFGPAILIVSLSPGFERKLSQGDSAQLKLIVRDSAITTLTGLSSVEYVIDKYNDDLLDARLASQGLDRQWLEPIQVSTVKRAPSASVATSDDEQGSGDMLATLFLPLAVTTWLLGGGMGLILDTTVGEKERQTIETMLATPASRVGIVLGKMSVVVIASIVVMGLWLSEGLLLNSFFGTIASLDGDSLAMSNLVSTFAQQTGSVLDLIAALLLLIIPFAIMLNGLVMAWCSYAANYREASLFMVLLNLALPAIVLLIVFGFPARVSSLNYALPLLGVIVAIRDLFGETLTLTGLLISFVSGSLYAAGSIGLAAWVFGREWGVTRGLR